MVWNEARSWSPQHPGERHTPASPARVRSPAGTLPTLASPCDLKHFKPRLSLWPRMESPSSSRGERRALGGHGSGAAEWLREEGSAASAGQFRPEPGGGQSPLRGREQVGARSPPGSELHFPSHMARDTNTVVCAQLYRQSADCVSRAPPPVTGGPHHSGRAEGGGTTRFAPGPAWGRTGTNARDGSRVWSLSDTKKADH